MFCENCGTKNKKNAKYCENCGHQLIVLDKIKNDNRKNKAKKISKTKIFILLVIVILIISGAIFGWIFFNNPSNIVKNSLNNYYKSSTKEDLKGIENYLISNKNNQDNLKKVKDISNETINQWVNDFNKEYDNNEMLDDSLKKIKSLLLGVYDYLDGIEYVLDYDSYYSFLDRVYKLYDSKKSYLKGMENKDSDEATAYTYFKSVIEDDCYYKNVQDFINYYLKDEIENFKKGAEEYTSKIDNNTKINDAIKAYIDKIKYIKDNGNDGNIDFSNTEEYKKLYNETLKSILDKIKEYTKVVDESLEYNKLIDIIDNVIEYFDSNTNEYSKLKEIRTNYKDKLPDSLLNRYLIDYSYWGSGSSKFESTILDKKYSHHIYFTFRGENVSRTYKLNKEYKKLKTTIIRSNNWEKSFIGEIKIYGDNKEIYSSGKISKNSELNGVIDVDVSNVDELKIEFVTNSKPSQSGSFYIYLVEPYLYN
ncbi:MAG: zinc-ribbon domain-containing protein [Bacilli bacterium]|nr:zinc-ribbon domain-containing protein [Bacilli bacterium]